MKYLILAILIFFSAFVYADESSDSIFNFVKELADNNKVDKAVDLLDVLIEKNPDKTEYYELRAKLNYDKKLYVPALKDYNFLIEKNNKKGEYFLGRAECNYVLKDYKLAINDLNKAVLLNKDLQICYFYLGNSFYNLKRDAEAIKNYQKYLNYNLNTKQTILTYVYMGNIYYNLNKISNAVEYYKKAESVDDQNITALFALMDFYLHNNYPDDALLYADKIISLYNATDYIYFVKAVAFFIKNDTVSANEYYEKIKDNKTFQIYVKFLDQLMYDVSDNSKNVTYKTKLYYKFLNFRNLNKIKNNY